MNPDNQDILAELDKILVVKKEDRIIKNVDIKITLSQLQDIISINDKIGSIISELDFLNSKKTGILCSPSSNRFNSRFSYNSIIKELEQIGITHITDILEELKAENIDKLLHTYGYQYAGPINITTQDDIVSPLVVFDSLNKNCIINSYPLYKIIAEDEP